MLEFSGFKERYYRRQGGALMINDDSLAEHAKMIAEKGTNRSLFLRGVRSSYQWHRLSVACTTSEI